jgi:hypothetical protein
VIARQFPVDHSCWLFFLVWKHERGDLEREKEEGNEAPELGGVDRRLDQQRTVESSCSTYLGLAQC